MDRALDPHAVGGLWSGMLTMTREGLWCAAGDFHVDPCRRVDRALITHAHSDHARPGADEPLRKRMSSMDANKPMEGMN